MADNTANTQTENSENAAVIEAAAAEVATEEPNVKLESEPEPKTTGLVDPDDAELAQLRAEVTEKPKTGVGEDGEDVKSEPDTANMQVQEVKQDDQGDDDGKGKGEDNAQGTNTAMIPKARLDESLDKQRRAEQDAAYWRGVAEARAGQSQGQGQQSEAEKGPSPQERIDALNSEIDKVWEQADDGEVSLSDARKKERKLEREIVSIEQESQAANQKPVTETKTADDLYLSERTERLAQDHPYVEKITSPSDWDFIRSKAIEALNSSEGGPLKPGPLADLKLREKMAELTDTYGPLLTGKTISTSQTNQPKPENTETGGMSQKAQDRLKKLETASQQPPNTGDLGGSGGMKDEVTEADINSMSDEEIAALPEATRRKFLQT